MSLQGNRAERAAKVRARIDALLGPLGLFKMTSGYLVGSSSRGRRCEGCAVAAACVALTDDRSSAVREEIYDRLEGHELITPSDIAQLEMGYEKWNSAWVVNKGVNTHEIAAIYSHPFYKLGRDLRMRFRPRWGRH